MATDCKPNRAIGSASTIAIQEETCWGTLGAESDPPAPQDAIGLEPTSDTLGNPRNTIESERVLGHRVRPGTERGNDRPGGDISKELQPNGPDPLLWKHLLGGAVTTEAAGDQFKHTIKGDIELPQGLSVQKRYRFRGSEAERLLFLGTMIGQCQISVPNEGVITAQYTTAARRVQLAESDMDASPTYPLNNNPFNSNGKTAVISTIDGSETEIPAPVRTLDLTVNNNLALDEYALDGNAYRADITPGFRVVNGSLTAFFIHESMPLLEAFFNEEPLRLDMTMTRGDYIWRIVIPRFKIRGDPPPKINGAQPIDQELEFEAEHDPDDETDIYVEITNDDPEISTEAAT